MSGERARRVVKRSSLSEQVVCELGNFDVVTQFRQFSRKMIPINWVNL
jgi:hypothetical protein